MFAGDAELVVGEAVTVPAVRTPDDDPLPHPANAIAARTNTTAIGLMRRMLPPNSAIVAIPETDWEPLLD